MALPNNESAVPVPPKKSTPLLATAVAPVPISLNVFPAKFFAPVPTLFIESPANFFAPAPRSLNILESLVNPPLSAFAVLLSIDEVLFSFLSPTILMFLSLESIDFKTSNCCFWSLSKLLSWPLSPVPSPPALFMRWISCTTLDSFSCSAILFL